MKSDNETGAQVAGDPKVFAPGEMFHDAKVETLYSEADYRIPFTHSWGARRDAKEWATFTPSLAAFFEILSRHAEGRKDGQAFAMVEMPNGARLNTRVRAVTGIGLDIDNGVSVEELNAAIKAANVAAFRYTTFSYGNTRSEFTETAVARWLVSVGMADNDYTSETLRRYVTEEKRWHPTVADSVKFAGTEQDHETGKWMVVIEHNPISKNRIIVPLAEPYLIPAGDKAQREAIRNWALYVEALANLIGVPFDKSCTDVARMYFCPRHAKGRDHSTSLFGGPLLRLEDAWFPESVLTDQTYNIVESVDGVNCGGDREEANSSKPGPEQESLLTLAELKAKIAALPKDAERDEYRPVVEAIAFAKHLSPGEIQSAKDALSKQVKALKPAVLSAELRLVGVGKQEPPIDPDTIKESESVQGSLVRAFGPDFTLPLLQYGHGDLYCKMLNGKPWYFGPISNSQGNKEYVPLCTPFTLDGVVRYVDKGGKEALRIRVLTGDGIVETVECEASALVKYNGSEVIGGMVSKGWRGEDEGEKYAVRYMKTQQRDTAKVYHRPGYREGVFVLATGGVYAPEGKDLHVELHADSKLKGPIQAGCLEDWKAANAIIFSKRQMWHHQVGTLFGLIGPVIGYVGGENMHGHFGGGTTNSKTEAMKEGGAHWAVPLAVSGSDGQEGCVKNARGTLNSYEQILQKHSGMYLAFDEFGKRPAQEQAEFAFGVHDGKGKSRQARNGGERELYQWHGLCVVTAAENSIGQILALANQRFDPGMTARMLPVDFSETVQFADDSEEWQAVLKALANYGHSGPEFIQAMLGIDRKQIEKVLAECVDELCKVNGKTLAGVESGKATPLERRACRLVAYVWVAAEIAMTAGLIPEQYDAKALAEKLWLDFLESDTAPVDPSQRAFETLLSNLSRGKGLDVVAFDDFEKPRSREAVAFHSVPENGKAPKLSELDKASYYYVVYAKALGKLSGNMANDAILTRMLDERGYLVRPNGEAAKKRMKHPSFPALGRGPFVVLRAEMVDDPEPEPDTDPEG